MLFLTRHCEAQRRAIHLSLCGEMDCFASLAMTVTCGLSLVDFGEHFARDAETVDAGGHAGIDRDLHEDFADLVLGDAVGQRALDVRAQFVRPVEDRDHGEVEHAAGLARQFLAAPDRAPAIFGEQFLERLVEVVDVLQGVVDIGLAEHGFANFQALVVRFLVHDVSLCVFTVRRRTLRGREPAVTPSCYAYFRVWVTPRNGCLIAAVVLGCCCRQPGEFVERRHPRPARARARA